MKYLFSLFLLVISTFAFSQEITETEVRQVMNVMEKSIKTRNMENLAAVLSDSVVLNLNIFNGSSYQQMTFDKQKYIQHLKGAFNQIKNHSYRIENEVIEIEQDQAILKYEMTESMAWGNQYFKLKSRGTTVFKRENGQLVVVQVDARTI